MACKNGQNEPESTYVEGQEVTFKVGVTNGGENYSSVSPRMIHGEAWGKGTGIVQCIGFIWEKDMSDVLTVTDLNSNKTSTFRVVALENKDSLATFRGQMPSGWTEGTPYKVSCGPSYANPPTSATANDYDGIVNNQMRFESETLTTIQSNINVKAVWAAMRIKVGVQNWWTSGMGSTGKYAEDRKTAKSFLINTIDICDKDGNTVLYHYNTDFSATISADTGESYVIYTFIVKPGNYDSFVLKFGVDPTQCGNDLFEFEELIGDGKVTFPTTLTLGPNEFLDAADYGALAKVRLKYKAGKEPTE